MKLFHLSDLHLGKRIYEFSMIEDQRYILTQILELVEAEKPDGVILAGDLYDKSVPSAEAVQLFDWFLSGLAERNANVFAISGNHDSAERIAFGSGLMREKGVHFSPVYNGEIEKITLEDEYGQADIWLMPFLKPAMVRHALKQEDKQNETHQDNTNEQDESDSKGEVADQNEQIEPNKSTELKIDGYQAAIEAVIDHMNIDSNRRNILVAHQFVTGAARCESEELNVGGLDQISGETFDVFDYVALGHIHSPQKIGRETVRYCGTPLKYSFSEAGQEKSVTVVELKEKGQVELRFLPLKPFRDMRKMRGTYLELMDRKSYNETNRKDYLHITLTDEEDIPDCIHKLRTVYPNLMQLEYDNLRTRQNQEITAVEECEQKSELELFEEFFEKQNNQPMAEEQKTFISELIEKLQEC